MHRLTLPEWACTAKQLPTPASKLQLKTIEHGLVSFQFICLDDTRDEYQLFI